MSSPLPQPPVNRPSSLLNSKSLSPLFSPLPKMSYASLPTLPHHLWNFPCEREFPMHMYCSFIFSRSPAALPKFSDQNHRGSRALPQPQGLRFYPHRLLKVTMNLGAGSARLLSLTWLCNGLHP